MPPFLFCSFLPLYRNIFKIIIHLLYVLSVLYVFLSSIAPSSSLSAQWHVIPAVTSLTQRLCVCRVCTRAQRKAGRCTARPQILTAGVCARWSRQHGTSANEILGVDNYAFWLNRCVCRCVCVCEGMFQWSALRCITGERQRTRIKYAPGCLYVLTLAK